MTRIAIKALAVLAMLLGSAAAHAAISCNISATGVTGIYDRSRNLDLSGSITVNCTRASGDPNSQTLSITIDQGEDPGGRDMTRQTSTDLLRYSISRNTYGGQKWTIKNNGDLEITLTFAGTSASGNYPYYFRVNSGITRPAGIYDDVLITAFLRTNSANGTLIAQVDFSATVSIPSHCYFSTPPSTLTMNYTSFSATPGTGSTVFNVSCTQSTPYTMALDATSGTLLGLNYTLALSSTGTIIGNGFGQSHSVTGTIAANQAGSCAAGNCSASQTRTLTINY